MSKKDEFEQEQVQKNAGKDEQGTKKTSYKRILFCPVTWPHSINTLTA